VSTNFERSAWTNTTVISSNVVEEVRGIKQQPGQDILQFGFGAVSKLLPDHGLLDELRLWIHTLSTDNERGRRRASGIRKQEAERGSLREELLHRESASLLAHER
jgi:dihydrofolate reductase